MATTTIARRGGTIDFRGSFPLTPVVYKGARANSRKAIISINVNQIFIVPLPTFFVRATVY
jgi:hypothetical protein